MTNTTASGEITLLLRRISAGDSSAESELMDRVYVDLKRMAARYLRAEPNRHALQATSLVHQAYRRLAEGKTIEFVDRTHFFAVSATILRRLLIDQARKNQNGKHGGGKVDSLEVDIPVAGLPSATLLDVDRALDLLARSEPRQARVVEMRYFGGMTEEEIAAELKLSVKTVKRDWLKARATLYGILAPRHDGGPS